MSQDAAGLLTLTRTTYERILPVLRQSIGPAFTVFATTVSAALHAGPEGVIPGAAIGAVAAAAETLGLYGNEIINAFRMALLFLCNYPELGILVREVIRRIGEFLGNQRDNQLEDSPQSQ